MSVNTFSKRTEIDLRSIQLRSILETIKLYVIPKKQLNYMFLDQLELD